MLQFRSFVAFQSGALRRQVLVDLHSRRDIDRPRRGSVCHAQSSGDFGENLKRIAKKVQGSLPVIGLLSRLASPEGGFDELSYPEYTRSVFERAPENFRLALMEVEKKYGKAVANSRSVLLLMWMIKGGCGLVPAKDIIKAAMRLRVTQDLEIEMDRFETSKINMAKKYSMIEKPEGSPRDKAVLAVDALCSLCLGLKDGEAVSEADAQLLTSLVCGAFPEVSSELVAAGIRERPQRATAYA
mmetsp:Transcript_12643/g.27341  ORF Transcript_12643/g.27341 Transcript_12643/m.27341 type:complete len:242 (+) Transcript_12643:98-823(+)